MNCKSIWQCIVITLILCPPIWATGSFAGGGAGNGRNVFTAAWFTEKQQISWCIYEGNNIGVENESVIRTMKHAFNIWDQYLDAKGLQENIWSQHDPNEMRPRLFAKAKYFSKCHKGIDLVLYLGTENQYVAKQKEKYYDTAIAFSHASSYDIDIGAGNGFIWLRAATISGEPEILWNDSRRLLGIFLHELGHVFGCGHLDGTIMHKNMAATILRKKELPYEAKHFTAGLYSLDVLDRIDFERELYFLPIGQTTVLSNATSNPDHNKAFFALTGKKPQGESSIFLLQKRYTLEPMIFVFDNLESSPNLVRTLGAAMNEYTGPLPQARISDTKVFKILSNLGMEWYYPASMRNVGKLLLPNGRSQPIRWLRNHAFDGTLSEVQLMMPDFTTLRLLKSNYVTRDRLRQEPYKTLIESHHVGRFE